MIKPISDETLKRWSELCVEYAKLRKSTDGFLSAVSGNGVKLGREVFLATFADYTTIETGLWEFPLELCTNKHNTKFSCLLNQEQSLAIWKKRACYRPAE